MILSDMMSASFWLGVSRGVRLPFAAGRLLLKHSGVKRVALLPLLVSSIVYLLAIVFGLWLIYEWDWGAYGFAWMGTWADGLMNALKWILLAPLIFFLCYFSFTMVGMVLASPFNDILSERVEQRLRAESCMADLPIRENLRATLLSMWDSLQIVLWQLGASVLALPFLLVPVVGVVPLFLVTAYYAGLGFVDIPMARNLLRTQHKAPMVRQYRGEILGLGIAMECLFLIPFFGLLLLPLGVVAGTLHYCRCDWPRLFEEASLPPPPGYTPLPPISD